MVLRYAEIGRRPPFLLRLSVKFLISLPFIGGSHRIALLDRFLESTALPFDVNFPEGLSESPDMEILFVCAGKDFELLQDAVNHALISTASHHLLKISLVVPESDVEAAKKIEVNPSQTIEVISENIFFTKVQFDSIRERFGSRSGWVVQQLLKVLYVAQSKAPGVLVCDADTMLLRNRIWFDKKQNQVLTPSWEYTESYYKFLSRYGLVNIKPKYTFVSHHMLMQPKFMVEAMSFMSWTDTDVIIRDLSQFYDGSDVSPFCIEFELYAHFLMKEHPGKVFMAKWANKSIGRKDSRAKNLSNLDFASVSLHDYL